MTADATLPASDDLTPEVLAETRVAALRSALPDSAIDWKLDGDPGIIEALLSGVRSRDARIAELEAERDALTNVIDLVDVAIGDPVHPRHRAETYEDLACKLINIVDKGTSEEDLAYWMSILAARDAEKWGEGFNACASGGSLRNPYRAGVDQ